MLELSTLRSLGAWRKLPAGAIAERRDAQMRRLVRHAYERVPHYRECLDRHGVRPVDVRTLADLTAIPTTTRPEVQALPAEALLARGVDAARLIEHRTSGASGRPLSIRRTWWEERLLGSYRWRTLWDLGWHPRDRHAEIEELEPPQLRDRTWAHHGLQALGLFRQRRIDALLPPSAILAELDSFAPKVVSGYAAVVARIAQTALTQGGCRLAARLVAVHSEVLTSQMRQQIGEAFGAPVRVIYDSHECNVIAWECATTGELHTRDDATLVEVLDADDRPVRPGESGEVVVTALHSFAMPFLRYRLGDIAIQGSARCACGLPFATLRSVQGRMFDYFVLPDGRLLHPYEIVAILGRLAPWVREYQLVQERRDLVVLRIVASSPPGTEATAVLRGEIEQRLGPAVTLRLDLVEALAREASAKFRICRSLVTSEYDDTQRSAS